jgi:hypothetical protein
MVPPGKVMEGNGLMTDAKIDYETAEEFRAAAHMLLECVSMLHGKLAESPDAALSMRAGDMNRHAARLYKIANSGVLPPHN